MKTRRAHPIAAALCGLTVLATAGCASIPGLPTLPPLPFGDPAATSSAPATPPPQTPAAPLTTGPIGSAGPAPAVLTATVPGWNPVRSTKRAAVYDVPPTWQVETEDTIVGYEKPGGAPRVAGSGAAKGGVGACGGDPNSSVAMSVVKHDISADLTDVATIYARQWADAAYRDDQDRKPKVRLQKPLSITTAAGQKAVIAKADATPATVDPKCGISEGAVYVITATGYRGELGPTVALIIVADEKLTAAKPIDESEIMRVLSTLRPTP